MAQINLLPWREEARTKRRRDFLMTFLLALLLTAVAAGAVHWQMVQRIDHQDARNRLVQSEISTLEAKLKKINKLDALKTKLLARMEIIQNLQISRPQIVHLFDEVAATLPDGVQLAKLSQTGKSLALDGQAQSNSRVSAYMRNIDSAAWIGSPSLVVIESRNKNKSGMSGFKMQARQRVPANDKPDGAAQ